MSPRAPKTPGDVVIYTGSITRERGGRFIVAAVDEAGRMDLYDHDYPWFTLRQVRPASVKYPPRAERHRYELCPACRHPREFARPHDPDKCGDCECVIHRTTLPTEALT